MAHDGDYGIGHENKLPWPNLKEDMAWFQKHTAGKVCIMGRRTWESLPVKPLPNRCNVVLTSYDNIPGVKTFATIQDVLAYYKKEKEIMLIGGALLFRGCRDFITRAYITTIPNIYPSDLKVEGNWEDWDRVYYDAFSTDKCSFSIYEKVDGIDLEIYYSKGNVSEK